MTEEFASPEDTPTPREDVLRRWVEDYQKTIETPPQPGDILRAVEGDALLTVEIKDGLPPFIYGRAFVPEILSIEAGWYLQSEDSHSFHGWKCILMPRARAALIQKCGLHPESMSVKSLRVIRASQTGKSLLCEIHSLAVDCKISETNVSIQS